MTVKIVKRNSAGNYDVVVSQAVSHPGSGWANFDLTSPYSVPASGSYYLGVYVPATTQSFTGSVARAYIASDATGTSQTLTEDTAIAFPLRYIHTVTPNNMTLVTAAQTAPSSTGGRVLIEYDPIDAITPTRT